MTIIAETLSYSGDGLSMQATLYTDSSLEGPQAGVLIYPEAFGPGEHVRNTAKRLAGSGYAAIVCDLHGDARLFTRLDEVMPLLDAIRPHPERIRARAIGAYEAARTSQRVDASRIAAIGYCFGGTMALELGRAGVPVKAITGFHSGLATAAPAAAGAVKAPVLVCIGADDPAIPPEQRLAFETEMRGAGADWMMHVYGGVVHGFTNPEAGKLNMPDFARYDAAADAKSWAAMMELLAVAFATEGRSDGR